MFDFLEWSGMSSMNNCLSILQNFLIAMQAKKEHL